MRLEICAGSTKSFRRRRTRRSQVRVPAGRATNLSVGRHALPSVGKRRGSLRSSRAVPSPAGRATFLPGGFAPPDPPTRSLAGPHYPHSASGTVARSAKVARVAHSLRSHFEMTAELAELAATTLVLRVLCVRRLIVQRALRSNAPRVRFSSFSPLSRIVRRRWMTDTIHGSLIESAHRTMTCHLDRRMGVVAALALNALMPPVLAAAQEANISTTVASLGSGTVASRISFDAVKPKPATDRGLALPSLILIDDGSGPRVTSLVLELPVLDLEGASVASRLGDQSLPAVFRAGPLAGSALTSPIRGLTFTTMRTAPLSLSFGQMGTGTPAPGSPAFAGAAVSLDPEHPPLPDTPRPDPQRLARCAADRRNRDPGERRRQPCPGDGRGHGRDRRHGVGAAGVSPSCRPMAASRHRDERAARRGCAPRRGGRGVRVVTRP